MVAVAATSCLATSPVTVGTPGVRLTQRLPEFFRPRPVQGVEPVLNLLTPVLPVQTGC